MALFHKPLHALKKTVTHAFIASLAVFVAGCGIFITAHYMLKYINMESQETKIIYCLFFEHPDCPDTQKEMEALNAKIAELEDMLSWLKAIENAVDEVNLFQTHTLGLSAKTVTVGTVYKQLSRKSSAHLKPEYFCYIALDQGAAKEARNLHFKSRNTNDFSSFDAETLAKAGLDEAIYTQAKNACKPYLIAGGA